ncbi:MAG: HAMP domain-containing protein [Pirellulaceae bacterium]|nr:HAMP domain-containing protein [Pirellulaceae bacterium]
MFFARIRRFTRTLHFRLMLGSALLVMLTVVLTLAGIQVGVRQALLHELDRFLVENVRELNQILLADPEWVARLDEHPEARRQHHRGHVRFAIIFDDQGQVVWSSDEQPNDLPMELALQLPGPRTLLGYRLVHRRFFDASGAERTVCVGVPIEVLNEEIARVDWLAAIVAGTALLLAPLIGFGYAGRLTRVLGDIMHRTARLRPNRRDERLPVRGTGDELDQLAQTVNRLLDRIASHLDRHEDFLADAAHELRTPVAAIRTTAEVALASRHTQHEYEEFLGDVVEACQSLEGLVSQLLLLSETESDRLRIQGQRVSLDRVVQRSAEMFRDLAASAGIDLTVETSPVLVEGNQHHLRQLLNNLLDNAIKFTPAGGRIHVHLGTEAAGERAVLEVRDTGAGIEADDLPLVFERFYRGADARRREDAPAGTGLGLSICRSIAEAHGGEITVRSQIGQGATFRVCLPLARF